MSSDTVGTGYLKPKLERAERKEQTCPLSSALCADCRRLPYGLAGTAGAGFCVAGGGVVAGGTAGGIAGLAVDGEGAAGFAVGAAAGFAAVAYLPESNRLITSPVMSSEGST